MIDGGSGIWSATAPNWTNTGGTTNGPMQPVPAFAEFRGAPGTVTIDDSQGVPAISSMLFNVNGYRLTGGQLRLQGGPFTSVRTGDGISARIDSELTGDSGLLYNALGTLTLTGTNSYTGGTLVSSGTFALAGNGALYSGGAVAVNGGAVFDISGLAAAGTTIGDLSGAGTVECCLEGIMHGVFGKVEVSKQANQCCKHRARLFAINPVQEVREVFRRILHGRSFVVIILS